MFVVSKAIVNDVYATNLDWDLLKYSCQLIIEIEQIDHWANGSGTQKKYKLNWISNSHHLQNSDVNRLRTT